MTIEIDDIDRALIDGLVADSRASYTALARQVSMSQAAVKARVTRLIDNGVIHILGRIDPHTRPHRSPLPRLRRVRLQPGGC